MNISQMRLQNQRLIPSNNKIAWGNQTPYVGERFTISQEELGDKRQTKKKLRLAGILAEIIEIKCV